MSKCIVQSRQGVTLVGGGAPQAENVACALALAPILVAADGGANACREMGHTPVAVIGDFDSVNPQTRNTLPNTEFHHVAEQDSTDFEKCLTRIEAPFILATGFTSARLDHTLAVLSVLVRGIGPKTVVLGEEDIVFAAPQSFKIDLGIGVRFSLFPLTQVSGTSTGLRWPIDGLTLEPTGQIGTSNETTGPVTLSFDATGCLVLVPRDALTIVLSTFLD